MPHLIPLPAVARFESAGCFVITSATTILVPPANGPVRRVGLFLSSFIGVAAGQDRLRVQAGNNEADEAIHLQVGEVSIQGDEAYEVTVTPRRIILKGRTAAGVFNAFQTLRQLLPPFVEYQAVRPDKSRPVTIPAARIADAPRFPWRGAMLDVARHFFSVADVKRYLDLMALHKLNRLHLHLADDQGWRLEIKSWPRLAVHGGSTEVGGGTGGYYTQAEYGELVEYAAERFITIVPEIDMPGHTNAALASYAELNRDGVAPELFTGIVVGFSSLAVDKDVTYKFVDDVVREIAAITPGPYFHIGGDEVQALTTDQYNAFIERVQAIVQSHGKQMIGWDETATAALAPTSIVQHWRPKTTPAAVVEKGVKVVLSPAERVYLDMKYDASTPIGLTWAALIDVRDAYDWEPATAIGGVSEDAILGVEAPLWTETAATIRDVEFLAFPRLAAVAEVAWSAAGRRNWEEFRVRLAGQAARWSALGINFYRSLQIPWNG